MARERSPTDPPLAKRIKKSSSNTTIASLGDDLLLEIFLRLPSLATLVRAAFTCCAWRRAVASSRDFRHRFQAIHAPPLLGLFFDHPGAPRATSRHFGEIQPAPLHRLGTFFDRAGDVALPALPSFVHALGLDRDQAAAAVHGGNFLATSLVELPGGPHGWEIHDCRGGYVLLGNGDLGTMVVLNPLVRQSERFFDFGHEDTLEGHRGLAVVHKACLLCSDDEDSTSFRVVIIACDESRVRATVFSFDTGEWSVHPWVDVPASLEDPEKSWRRGSMQANGVLYWISKDCSHMLALDTATMEFTSTELPRSVRRSSSLVGETKNGAPCVVYAFFFKVGVLLRRTDSDGVERWMKDKVTSLYKQLGKLKEKKYENIQVMAVTDGYAFLAASPRPHFAWTWTWVFSFCLETMKLEKAFQRPYECCVNPCVMAWSPCLVGNYGSFALEDEMHIKGINMIQRGK